MLYLRLNPGAYFDENSRVPRQNARILPLSVDHSFILDVMTHMSPTACYTYLVLGYYDQVKFETYTPGLGYIYSKHFANRLTIGEFVGALYELENLIIDGQPLLCWCTADSEPVNPSWDKKEKPE